jgi:hypothetical protein
VQFLGRDTDLSPEPEFLAIDEARRCVHQHCSGVDLAGEPLGGAEVTGHNPQRLQWSALALPLPLLEELAEVAAPRLRTKGELSVLMLPPDRSARLAGTVAERALQQYVQVLAAGAELEGVDLAAAASPLLQ